MIYGVQKTTKIFNTISKTNVRYNSMFNFVINLIVNIKMEEK